MAPLPPDGTRISSGPNGRCLIATRTFPPGAVIGKFPSPIIALPDGPGIKTTCNWCLRVGSEAGGTLKLKACTACKAAVYCDAKCQRAHWKYIHKAECRVFTNLRETLGKDWLPTPVRATVQVLLHLKGGDAVVTEAFRGSEKLQGNVEGFKSDPQVWKDFELMSMAAATYSGQLQNKESLDEAMKVLCQVQTNAFNRLDPDTGATGIFLDPSLAMVNHSCIYNAFVGFEKRTATLRATQQIDEGDEIMISYIDSTLPRSTRQGALRLYHFTCGCPRCSGNLDAYEVCQSLPAIPLNSFSLQPDLKKLQNPSIDRSKVTKEQVERIHNEWYEKTNSRTDDAMDIAEDRWKICKPLVEANMWAIEPVPSTILGLCNYWQTQYKWVVYALPLACFLATECDPVKYPAPFETWRVKGIIVIVQLLAVTGELTSSGELAKRCPHEGIVGVLALADQVTMCQGLLHLAIHHGLIGADEDWQVLKDAKAMLKDLESLPGREKESSLIQAWAKNPEDPQGKVFFEEEVLKPVKELSSIAPEILDAMLGNSLQIRVSRG
ncbi:hypothetical protein QBC38DRAFT_468621 [Podospora fimiseda]|uniref:Suppressor of anucleate metulae protein B n=1 Tax=Podospora fimiseda TaxID=252190 RepID=A0AAN7BW40_9PEZI|nr:hypothetical protein QBC38DRAFT_468621 [Podospora fimiseda]